MRRIGFFGKREIISLSFQNLSGLIVPLLTPLNEDKSIDFLSLKTLTARLLNKGVKSFFLFGPYSEQEFLSFDDRVAIMEVVFKEVNGKGFLLAGCFGKNNDEIIERVTEAQKFTNYCVVSIPKSALEDEVSFVDFFDFIFFAKDLTLFSNDSTLLFKLGSLFTLLLLLFLVKKKKFSSNLF